MGRQACIVALFLLQLGHVSMTISWQYDWFMRVPCWHVRFSYGQPAIIADFGGVQAGRGAGHCFASVIICAAAHFVASLHSMPLHAAHFWSMPHQPHLPSSPPSWPAQAPQPFPLWSLHAASLLAGSHSSRAAAMPSRRSSIGAAPCTT